MSKSIIITLVLAVIAAGGFYLWQSQKSKAATAASAAPAVYKVVAGDIFQAVASTGNIASNLDVDIKCKASGQIITLTKDVSQAVKKGELLIEVDPVDANRNVEQAQALVDQATAKLEEAKQNVLIAEQSLKVSRIKAQANAESAAAQAKDARSKANRRKELLEQKLASPEDYETADTAALGAEANVKAAQSQIEDLTTQELSLELKRQDVKLAQAQLASDKVELAIGVQKKDDTKVIAPIDGVVSALGVQKGQIISSGITNVGGGTTAMTISDLSSMYVLATVDESEIGKVAVAQGVNVTADAFPGRRFKGKVVRIATKGVNVSNVVTFEVKIEVLDDKKSLLRPLMTANVQIVANEKSGVPTVPMNAVSRKEGKLWATVVTDRGTEERPVQVGLTDGEKWEIIAGLNVGDTVQLRKESETSRWSGGGARPTGGPGAAGGSGGGRGR